MRDWGNTGKVKTESKVKTTGEKMLALCDKVEELTDGEAKAIVEKLSAMMHNRAIVQQAALQRKLESDAKANAAIAKAKRDARKLAKAS